jgi:DNA end-binding protein Ku
MPVRPIASATVSFGLVSVPVQLYSSSESQAKVSFNWLHHECGSRLKQQYVCKQDDAVVERDAMIKGYEFAKGQYVTFTPEELKALEERATGTIKIVEFIPAATVDRIFLDKLYYLGPDKGGDRAYRLLSRALRDAGLVAIATYAARGKQYLVMVRPVEDGLALEQMHYADEIRRFAEIPIGEGEVDENELALARQFIEQTAGTEFAPERYRDEVRERMLEQIQRKVDGEEITAAPTEEPERKIIDLMDALKQSLAAAPQGDDEGEPPSDDSGRKAS